jgi:hypothetical protein
MIYNLNPDSLAVYISAVAQVTGMTNDIKVDVEHHEDGFNAVTLTAQYGVVTEWRDTLEGIWTETVYIDESIEDIRYFTDIRALGSAVKSAITDAEVMKEIR